MAHTTFTCLLAHDGHTMPSTSSTIAVVESQQRGDRGHGGPRSLKGQSPFVCISQGGAALSSCLVQKKPLESSFTLRLYACWLTTAVPCRQYHAVSEKHSCRCGVTTAGRPRPRWAAVTRGEVTLRTHIRGRSRPLALFGAKTLLVSSLLYAWPITRPYASWLATTVPGRQRAAQSPL